MKFEKAFDNAEMVTAYEGRPLYHDKVISLLLDQERGAGGIIRDGDVLADLGAGQGRFLSSLFTAQSFQGSGIALSKIFAVEPSSLMLAELRARFRERNNLEAREGIFQNIPLDDNSVDVAVCGSSLHWGCITEEDAEKTARELGRILKDDGRLVLLGDSISQQPGINKEIHDLKRAPELLFSKQNGFGKHTYSIFPEYDVQTALYWNYEATAADVEAEYRSQAYIQDLSDSLKTIFFENLKEIVDRYSDSEERVGLQRGCAVIAGPYPSR